MDSSIRFTKEQVVQMYKTASPEIKSIIEDVYPNVKISVQIEKCERGVRVTTASCDFVIFDLPIFYASHVAAMKIAKALGGTLPSKEWLQIVYDNRAEINSLLENKFEDGYYWSSTPFCEGCFWYLFWSNGSWYSYYAYYYSYARPFSAF